MSYLPFPFKKNGILIFKNPGSEKTDTSLSVEIAESTMELFQALSYRKLMDFREPLLLNFPDPHQQNFVMLDNNFSVKVITVGCDNVITNIYNQEKKSNRGYFIKSFTDLKMVILSNPEVDICCKYDIQKKHTTVELVSYI
jgi:uncharacterized membrane protein (UPF0127 family)